MADLILGDTVGSLLAHIATSLQDALRILIFADKRGWGRGEFEQVRALEEALAEAKRDFQAMAPLVNGQFYYENDRRPESLAELRVLRANFTQHAQMFKDWLRTGGPMSPLWARETVNLRRQLHRAQCRAARRIFNAEREDGGSGARCLGAYLIYRRLRQQKDRLVAAADAAAAAAAAASTDAGAGTPDRPPLVRVPTWKLQQLQRQRRDAERFAGRERLSRGRTSRPGRAGRFDDNRESLDDIELSGLPRPGTEPESKPDAKPKHTATASVRETYTDTTPPSSSTASPHSTTPWISLEDLVPDCNAIGTFERFGDRDIAFVCDFCDGHIVWDDVLRLPTTRTAAAASSASGPHGHPPAGMHTPSSSEPQVSAPFSLSSPPTAAPSSTLPSSSSPPARPPTPDDEYPHWQATTVAVSDREKERTIVFAPLVIANHLPPTAGDWEARLWCPYCDEYMYYDSAEGDHTKYAQEECGFPSLAAFQEHLEWEHTALPIPAIPAAAPSCTIM